MVRRVGAKRRRVGSGQRWPGIATPALSAGTAGACFLLGSVAVLLLAMLAPSHFTLPGVACAASGVAGVVGIGVLVWRHRLRPWQFHVLVVTATALITVTVHNAATAATAVSLATFYVFVAFAAFFIFWQHAAVHLAVALACCLSVLGAMATVPWWSALIVAVTTAAMGTVIAILGRLVSNAERDAGTDMPNRRGFDRIVGLEIAKAQAGGAPPAVMLLGMEGLGGTDDKFGPRADSELLYAAVDSWRDTLTPDDTLARVGQTEFAVLLAGATEQDGVEATHRLRAATSVDCSAGVTGWQPGESANVLLSRAEVALQRAKRSGGNRTMVESSTVASLASELADAIATNAVDVVYQPIVRLGEDNTIVGVEALVRWGSPTRPDIAISEVISIAENSNLIAELDRYVLRRACVDVQWMQQQWTGSTLTLTVNVSGLELMEKGYVATVTETLAATGWPAEQLVLEITESVVDVDMPTLMAVLRDLRAHGIRVAIDDFGTGYSTLSRLQNLPIDLIKLDASFTAHAALDRSATIPPLLQAIAALARALDLPVVIEGVETAEQAEVSQRAGFAMAQGYFFGRPQLREKVVDLLTIG